MSKGIGGYNESTLHRQLKSGLANADDLIEHEIDGYIVDIVRGDQLIEIQTANFGALRPKLLNLIAKYRIRVIYPLAIIKWIIRLTPEGKKLGRRKSPKKATRFDVFNELVYLHQLLMDPNFSLEILFVEIEETRSLDGRGSWRRRGYTIKDRVLVQIMDSYILEGLPDYNALLPNDLVQPFSSKELALRVGVSIRQARKITYVLRHIKVLKVVGKRRNELIYESIVDDKCSSSLA